MLTRNELYVENILKVFTIEQFSHYDIFQSVLIAIAIVIAVLFLR